MPEKSKMAIEAIEIIKKSIEDCYADLLNNISQRIDYKSIKDADYKMTTNEIRRSFLHIPKNIAD